MELRQNKKGTEDPSRTGAPPRRSLMGLVLLLMLLPFPRLPSYFFILTGRMPPLPSSADLFSFLVSLGALSSFVSSPRRQLRPSKRQEPSVSSPARPFLKQGPANCLPLRSPWSAAVPHAERDKTKDDDAAAAAREPRGN